MSSKSAFRSSRRRSLQTMAGALAALALPNLGFSKAAPADPKNQYPAKGLDLVQRSVIMGLQNADEFREPKEVKAFYELGLRCAQLTYNSQNFIGSGSTDRVDGG